jgi:hypothetical protein
MEKTEIQRAYRLAGKYAETKEQAVQIGIQMALNGEVLLDEDNNLINIE